MDLVDMPVLQMLMLAIMFFAILVEIKTGGLGAGIMLGIVAAGVFWGSQYVKGLVSFYEIGMFLVGILCIIIELLSPTVGLLAGVGVAALLYSVVLALGGDMNALFAMLISFVVAILAFVLILKRLPSSRLWSKVVLKDQSTSSRGYVSATPQDALVGEEGVVLTELRPSGSAELAGHPVDVVSEGAFLEKGARVRVIAVQGARVVVRRV